jgi:hypothetical protein
MTALAKVPKTELWTSFPEVTRNDVLGLLSMLLERLAVFAHAGGGGAFTTLKSRSGCGDASGRGTAPDLRAGVGGGGGVRVL